MSLAVALVGMPGGGKTTVGRQLARRLNIPFLDTDALIELRVGCTVREFFDREGEEQFREHESAVVTELPPDFQGVLATGGGTVLREQNRLQLRDKAVCVYLRSTPEDLMRRLRHDAKRPLLQVADPLSRLRELFAQRDPLYQQTAHFVVETGRPSVPGLVNMVLMQLELAGVIDATRSDSPVDSANRGAH